MEILTSVRRLYISFKSLVNVFVYSFGRAALLLLVEVQNHTVPVRERRRIRVKYCYVFQPEFLKHFVLRHDTNMMSISVTFNLTCFGPTRFLLSDKKMDTALLILWFIIEIHFRTLRYCKCYADSNSSMKDA